MRMRRLNSYLPIDYNNQNELKHISLYSPLFMMHSVMLLHSIEVSQSNTVERCRGAFYDS